MSNQGDLPPSVFPEITPFSFTQGSSALRKAKAVQNCSACRRRKTKCDRLWPCTPCKDRGEASLCEQYIKEPNDKPTGYTHVLDTSILANRVAQLEAVLSRLLTRVDSVAAYNDLLNEWKAPLPEFKPKEQEEREAAERERGEKPDADMKRPTKRRDSESTAASRHVSAGLAMTMAHPVTPGMASLTPQRFGATNVSIETSSSGAGIGSTISPTAFGQQQQGMEGMSMDLNYLSARPPEAGPSNWLEFANQPTPPMGQFLPEEHREYEPASKAPSAHEHDAALALEGMALGRELLIPGGEPRSEDDNDEPTPGSPLTFTRFIHRERNSKLNGELKNFPQAARLPSIIFGKYIINHFLENVDFRWRCLHRPTFEAQYAALSNRLRSKSTQFYGEELSSLALYASCLAVGIHFLDEEGYRDLNLNEEQAENLAAKCWDVSYAALEASDWMQVHDIRSCQTLIIAGIYLSSARRANQHWTLLGSVTKIAMALGLASVPDESKIISGEVKRIPMRWRNTIDREVARRVWYCLLELDQLFAIEYGFLYLISPEISQTTEPANINDGDIKPDQPVYSLPRDTYTDMSYFLQRLQLFYPFQGVVQKSRRAGRMRYSFVIEANRELQNAIANMPPFFRENDAGTEHLVDASQMYKLKRESIALSEGADLRLMRLHRYYFSEACNNPRYLLSKQTCLQCARRILGEQTPRLTNVHYWGHTYCIFAATMVVIIYLSYALPQELEETKAQAESGIAQLRSLSRKRRTDLGESADVLSSLMNVQLERRVDAPTSELKRNFSDVDASEWEGWLPPDLVALARMNPGFLETPADPNTMQTGIVDAGLVFDNMLEDLSFNHSNFILM
ncbi:hypothetical protein CspeluHIS016_0114910 [Cutaneotrichosporon spelunceum]|uniref:Zn(2)-C6 fungal-type domain-containing protein n=1 Tax=Cutaneotrichosporon spelunceum TaxID=1672016 RepID=A0AAD3Y9E2_9TREE|nr:hypothetical protein CspeluHIS016_0114910 [Cutaneotrichosporon spelunceum]